jgi:hypothetical protein
MVYIDGAYDSKAYGALRPRAQGREAINHFETTQ